MVHCFETPLQPIYLREPHITDIRMTQRNIADVGLKSIETRCGTTPPWCASARVGVELLAVVKANGYGHGMVGVAKALAQGCAVVRRRKSGRGDRAPRRVSHPIIISGRPLPEERAPIAERRIHPVYLHL